MDSKEFRKHGKEMIDWIADYLENVHLHRVTPEVHPGYLRKQLPNEAPLTGDSWKDIMRDVKQCIMPGITHWQHPNFHAYFPLGNSFPSILGDILSDGLGINGFSWAASPACTELEVVVVDWLGKMIGLPKCFLHEDSGSTGGGVVQGSASDCILVCMLAARHKAIQSLKTIAPLIPEQLLMSKLVGYTSCMAHSAVEKAGIIAAVKIRQLDVDADYSLRGETLAKAIKEDRKMGLIPFYVCATLGTTACCSSDNIKELGTICSHEGMWLHIDASYAGNALICPEFRHLIKGIENVDSLNLNPNKWMMVNFDCSLMWTKDRDTLESSLTVNPIYLKHAHSDKAVDFRHWGVPLSRRFRSLKIWFVIRTYGIGGLQKYIRTHVEMAKSFGKLIENDDRFEILGRITMGLVCFRIKGENYLTQELLHLINSSGKLHMVPAMLNQKYVIRYAICVQDAKEKDNQFAWGVIKNYTDIVLQHKDQNEIAPETQNGEIDDDFDSDEVFGFTEEVDYINMISPSALQDKSKRNSLFRMISDPKCYHPRVMKSLSHAGKLEGHKSEQPKRRIRRGRALTEES